MPFSLNKEKEKSKTTTTRPTHGMLLVEAILTYIWYFRFLRKCSYLIWIYCTRWNTTVWTGVLLSRFPCKSCIEVAVALPPSFRCQLCKALCLCPNPLLVQSSYPLGHSSCSLFYLWLAPFSGWLESHYIITEINCWDWKGPWQALRPALLCDKKKKKKGPGIEVTGSSLEFLVALAKKEPMFFNINWLLALPLLFMPL